ncbi:hypothetical protein Poly30_06730 [Planctomycetes bacterium Poly30]|uniref:Uncharacterized protein n=1 Tax=Saltatorellus ferox TaxID=2528018 RepID=A0A518EM70_9BACT|nr:hypothetical protein Poly30_06730 [Planctomycetes bacterium Poly30]
MLNQPIDPSERPVSVPRQISHLPQIVLFTICALTLLVGLSG